MALKKIYLSIFLFISVFCVSAQNTKFNIFHITQWNYPIGNYTSRNIVQNDSGFVTLGGTSNIGTKLSFYFFDSLGNFQYKKNYGDTMHSYGHGIYGGLQKTQDGSYIVSSVRISADHSDTLHILGEVFIMKFNKNLDSLWTKYYEATWDTIWWNPLNSYVQTCCIDKDGNYIGAGASNVDDMGNPVSGASQLFVMKTDTTGNLLWKHTYNYIGNAYSIDFDNENNYWIAGASTGPVAQIWKISPSGQMLWNTTYDYNLSSYQAKACNTLCLPDSSIIISGAKCRGNDNLTSYSINYKNQQKNWDLYYYPGEFYSTSASPVMSVLTHDNNYIQAGLGATWDTSYCNFFADTLGLYYSLMTKNNYNGKVLWSRKIRPPDPGIMDSTGTVWPIPNDIILTRDNGFALTGWGNDTASDYITWLVKTDSLGCDGLSSCDDTAMVLNLINPLDTICVYDTTWLNFELNGLSAPYTLIFSNGDTIKDIYYNQEYIAISGPYTDTSLAMVFRIYQQYPLIVTDTSINNIDLKVTLQGYYGRSKTQTYSFYVKDCHIGIKDIKENNDFIIYPNPSEGDFTIEFTESSEGDYISIANITGQIIKVIPLIREKNIYHYKSNLPTGVYLVGINQKTKTKVKQLVVY